MGGEHFFVMDHSSFLSMTRGNSVSSLIKAETGLWSWGWPVRLECESKFPVHWVGDGGPGRQLAHGRKPGEIQLETSGLLTIR